MEKTKFFWRLFCLFVVCVAFTFSGESLCFAAPIYTITDLGTLGGLLSDVSSINDNGQIVGYAQNAAGYSQATLFDATGKGNNIGLGTLPGWSSSWAYSINNNGQIVGSAQNVIGYLPSQAILFDATGGGNNIDLGTLPGERYSHASSINDNGQIVGYAYKATGYYPPRATLFDATGEGNNIDLGALPDRHYSRASSINNNGQIVGYAYNPPSGYTRATLFDATGGGNNIDLGTLGGHGSRAFLINDNGQIVGSATNAVGYWRATLFDATGKGNNIDLGTLGGSRGWANSINDNGQIVGYAGNSAGYDRATLFDATGGGTNIDLNTLIDPTLGWTLTQAKSINDKGQIVGNGLNPAGQTHAFLLTSVVEPPPPPPKTYGLFIGSNDYTLLGLGEIKVNGWADAALVKSRFEELYGFADARILNYKALGVLADPWRDIQGVLEELNNAIRPRDTLIFFYSGHGGGSREDLGVDESLDVTWLDRITDDALSTWFLDSSRRDKWASVNKLFILDSCYSGGFWNGEDADLSGLEKVALLAAASELNLAYARQEDGRGYFSLSLEDGLGKELSGYARADIGKDGLTVQDLTDWLKNYPAYQNGITGYLKDGWSDELVTGQWGFTASVSPDFEMIIPEPTTLSLLVVGGFLIFRRRKKERGYSF